MASSKKESAAVDVKAALEAFAGNQIDATQEQIEERIKNLTFPYSTYAFTPSSSGEVVSKNILVFRPRTCAQSELLDVSSASTTGSTGNVTLLINDFLCPSDVGRGYGEPVNIVATPASTSPFYVTVTHSLIAAAPPNPQNVQINIFAWDTKGAPAPNVVVNWRCRVPTYVIIL
jgi:hypothetical protein